VDTEGTDVLIFRRPGRARGRARSCSTYLRRSGVRFFSLRDALVFYGGFRREAEG
jgi:hypothetical protein